ncbi:ABC transporter ATP-binding protein [Paenibacillus sabuli]|nr:ABC transporter ATP-binding protein [Paenibacillus sabuli]
MTEQSHSESQAQPEVLLRVDKLRKRIRGRWIIDDVSFEVRAGEIFGFLGPNGAGKTTTIRMLVDLIRPTSGSVQVCGRDVRREPEQALEQIGCIVENPEVYPYLTGRENLAFAARMLRGIGAARIDEVVRLVGMTQRIDDKVRTYSLGMRQRLGIAMALLGKPRLLILDEPTNGLDPKGIKELRAFVRMLAGQGMGVFISSHLLSEIQLMCDRVAIIGAGRVLTTGAVHELTADAPSYVVWQLQDREAGLRLLEREPQAEILGPDAADVLEDTALAAAPGAIVTTMPPELVAPLVARMTEAGIGVDAVQPVMPTLESLFLKLTEGEGIV